MTDQTQGTSTVEVEPFTVSWTRMEEGTAADYLRLGPMFDEHARARLVDNLAGLMELLQGPTLGYQINRYDHSLQSATRAFRNGERVDLVVAALLHDVGDGFAPENHSDAAATLLAPYVDDEAHWIVKHHGIFQGYYYFHHEGGDRHARERYRESKFYDACIGFCAEYDQNCFDPAYDNMSVDDFRPMMDEVFSRPSKLPGVAPLPA